ncbi:DUF1223 domain-containing protein [Gymnodinialimonas ulvae]|uniref:DUF1223 domain-containing protein n=1 Tax=Gymnodinialimonas ulvae TaxID=3126504 RepID=UPI0030B6B7A0
MAGPALADGPVVVELFTSQGCAACPPADALLGELAGRDDVIALALHVDYWDYIGWEDTFADPAFTARQHGYAHSAGSTVVYTPQMVVGGVDHVGGHRPMQVADSIAAHRAAPDPVEVVAEVTDTGWQVRATWTGAEAEMPPMVVQVVTFVPEEHVEITRGENAGLTTVYHNIVQSWQAVAEWSGTDTFDAQVIPTGDMRHVVIVQATDHGAIMGAARLD